MRFSTILFVLMLSLPVLAEQFELTPSDSAITAPGTIYINILLNNTQPVYGFELSIKESSARSLFSHIETTSRTTNALATSVLQADDKVKVAVVLSASGPGITAGTGSVLKIVYSATGNSDGEITYTPENLAVYNINGTTIQGNSIAGTTVTLQESSSSSSASGGASGGGAGGGGASGTSGSSSAASTSSASSSTSSFIPFSQLQTKEPIETPAPEPLPEVIEANLSTAEELKPAAPKRNYSPFIVTALIMLTGGVIAIFVFVKDRGDKREKYAKELKQRQAEQKTESPKVEPKKEYTKESESEQ